MNVGWSLSPLNPKPETRNPKPETRNPKPEKTSRYFHTLGYEMGNLQKLVFFHTQKVLFHTLENNFIPWSLFHTLKTFFIPLYINFIPLKFVSYLENFFHTFMQQFHTLWIFFLLFTVLSFHTKHKHFVPWAWRERDDVVYWYLIQ